MHLYKYFLEQSLVKSLFHQEYRVQLPVPLVLPCIHLFLLKMFRKYCTKIFSEFLKIFQGRADFIIKLFLVVLYMSSINCVKRVPIRSYSSTHLSRICPHSDWIWRDTPYLSVFSPNAGKCGKNADQNNFEYGHFLCSIMPLQSLILQSFISFS